MHTLHKSQIGFLLNKHTVDHVFTLRTLIDRYVHNHNCKICPCFVDLRKAVWHNGLWNKLLQINLGGSFYNLIKSLNSKSSCSIKIDQYQTRPFQCARGVRQGCILSPLLFNLSINDLPFSFESILSDPFVLPNGKKLNALLYADDFQNRPALFNALASYCNRWMLSIFWMVVLNRAKILLYYDFLT